MVLYRCGHNVVSIVSVVRKLASNFSSVYDDLLITLLVPPTEMAAAHTLERDL